MNNLEEKVSEYYRQNDNLLLAVSGGADSMALLFATKRISEEKDFNFRVITVDHGIRGQEAERDVTFVADECKKLGVECKIVKIDVPAIAKKLKMTIEEAARAARYEVLEKNCAANEKIVVAHNQDDQVETVLMHIFRGSGIDGARGIPKRDNILRPMISISKADILDYVAKNKISYQNDSTNSDLAYSRNYVRNKIIPQIEEVYPNFKENIYKFATICENAANLVDSLVDNAWFSAKNGVICVKTAAFLQNPLIVAKAVKKAYNMLGEYSDLESKHIEIVKELFDLGKNGTKVDLPHSIVAEKRNDCVYFYKHTHKNRDVCDFKLGLNTLPNGGCWNVSKISVDQVDFTSDCYFADYHKIPHDAVWRTRKDGDKFEKLGSRGSKKLNDYFTDKKLTIKERDTQILLASGSEVLLVLGRDVSNKIKIDDGTSDIVKFEQK
ncbi:MAG: tRNA lysidine(34) synthetase TilS [Clostridia bacterium]|nr:tRNA lysidine(34) synthetase TilS [Clostridia bacterium]